MKRKDVTSSKRQLNMPFYVVHNERQNVQTMKLEGAKRGKILFFNVNWMCKFVTFLFRGRRGCLKNRCISETLTWIKPFLENSVINSRETSIVAKWSLNCDVLWFLKCCYEDRVWSIIPSTSFPRENLRSTAIKNFDVVSVGSKSWQCFFFKKISHISSKHWPRLQIRSTKLNSSCRECSL